MTSGPQEQERRKKRARMGPRGAFAAGIAAGAVVLVCLVWPMGGSWFLVRAAATFIGLVGGVALLATALAQLGRAAAPWLLFAGTLLMVQTAAIPAHSVLMRLEVARAKAYCESLLPKIDGYVKAHGAEPERLEDLGELRRPPRLLRGHRFFHTEGPMWAFVFADPLGFGPGLYVYSGQSRRWFLSR